MSQRDSKDPFKTSGAFLVTTYYIQNIEVQRYSPFDYE